MKRSCAVAAVALFWTALGFHAPARLPLLRAGGASPGGRASALRRPAGSRRGVTLRRQLSEETCEEMARREDVESRTLTPSKMARARAPPPRLVRLAGKVAFCYAYNLFYTRWLGGAAVPGSRATPSALTSRDLP